MESNVSFSTPVSSEGLIYIDLSSEPFLAKENNSLVNQGTSFHIPDFKLSWSFLANQQFQIRQHPLNVAPFHIRTPISISKYFQISMTKKAFNKCWWQVDWLNEVISNFLNPSRSSAYAIFYLQLLLTGEAKVSILGYGWTGSFHVPALDHLEVHFGNPNWIVNASHDKLPQCFKHKIYGGCAI